MNKNKKGGGIFDTIMGKIQETDVTRANEDVQQKQKKRDEIMQQLTNANKELDDAVKNFENLKAKSSSSSEEIKAPVMQVEEKVPEKKLEVQPEIKPNVQEEKEVISEDEEENKEPKNEVVNKVEEEVIEDEGMPVMGGKKKTKKNKKSNKITKSNKKLKKMIKNRLSLGVEENEEGISHGYVSQAQRQAQRQTETQTGGKKSLRHKRSNRKVLKHKKTHKKRFRPRPLIVAQSEQ